MDNKITSAIVTVLLGVIAVASVAVLVSQSANTSGVIKSGTSGFAQALCTALSPLGISNSQCLIENVTSTITFG